MQSKSILAKLLANENISVHHGNYPTAFFDVEKRVLGLPIFKDFGSKDTVDLFLGHEVGHALFTPYEGWHDSPAQAEVPRSFLNVVEDVRIERKIQAKYPGLISSFKRGYTVLFKENFFNTQGRDLQSYSLIDRINIKAKLRDLVDIQFSDDEAPYVKDVFAAETWDEVVDAAKAIYEFMKENQEEENYSDSDQSGDSSFNETEDSEEISVSSSEDSMETEETPETKDSMETEESTDTKETEEDEETTGTKDSIESEESTDTKETEEDEETTETVQSNEPSDLTSETDDALRANEDRLIEDRTIDDRLIVHVRDVTWNKCKQTVFSYDTLKQQREEAQQRMPSWVRSNSNDDSEYDSFVKETDKITTILAKEFEMRKAAYRYSRSKTAKSGSLNVNKLHSYKYDDDIFKKVTQLADSKSHGMVMVVDYSGSMVGVLNDTIKQVLNLATFCKKVNIPFEVYGFTSNGHCSDEQNQNNRIPETNEIDLRNLRIVQLLDSSMKKNVYNEAYKQLYLSTHVPQHYRAQLENLGITPLNECLLVMNNIVNQFKNKHSIQKVNFVLLTDGFGGKISVNIPGQSPSNFRGIGGYTMEINGKTIKLDDTYSPEMTTKLLDAFRQNGVSTIGFFLAEGGRDLYAVSSLLTDDVYKKDKLVNELKVSLRRDKFSTRDNAIGYDRLFILKAARKSLNTDVDELEIDENASKAKIISSFKKYSSSKKGNRILATKFAEIVS